MASSEWWKPYESSATQPWNIQRVVHLHRRAAFGASWPEIERDLSAGAEASIGRLMSPAPENGMRMRIADDLEQQAVSQQQIELLQATWIMRMWHGPNQVDEQLALMWHNHFATSQLKVQNVRLMRNHLSTLRASARKPFPELLDAMLRDPAMLVWLDADSNRKGKPNENLARELMELFTLGHGNYTEKDVQETARALTGWTIRDNLAVFDRKLHDDGMKEILGIRGQHGLSEVVKIFTSHRATYQRIAWRLCDHFFGPDAITDEAVDALSSLLQNNQWSIEEALRTIMHSDVFFSNAQIRRRVSSPASYVIGSTRALQVHGSDGEQGLSPQVASAWMREMGQSLLQPPGVGGWPGGRSWLGTTALVERTRFAAHLASGSLHAAAPQPNLERLMKQYHTRSSPEEFASSLLFGDSSAESIVDADLPVVATLLASTSALFD